MNRAALTPWEVFQWDWCILGGYPSQQNWSMLRTGILGGRGGFPCGGRDDWS